MFGCITGGFSKRLHTFTERRLLSVNDSFQSAFGGSFLLLFFFRKTSIRITHRLIPINARYNDDRAAGLRRAASQHLTNIKKLCQGGSATRKAQAAALSRLGGGAKGREFGATLVSTVHELAWSVIFVLQKVVREEQKRKNKPKNQ